MPSFALDLADLLADLVELLGEARALGFEIDDAGERHGGGRLADDDLHRALEGRFGEVHGLDTGETAQGDVMGGKALPCRSRGAGDGQGHHRRGRHVHLGADRAHGADEVDQPVDLVGGGGVLEIGRRPFAQRQHRASRAAGPQLLGDEGHEGMEQAGDAVERPGDGRPRLVLGRAVLAVQHRLGELEIPVAEEVPDEAVEHRRGLVELVGLECRRGCRGGARRLGGDPAVERLLRTRRVEAGDAPAVIVLGEAGGVPELGGEVAVALDAAGGELDVAALRRHRGKREAHARRRRIRR